MKRMFWLGLLFLSTSWLFFIPIFNLADYNIGSILLIAGIICNTFAFWKHDINKISKKYLIILIPLLISLFIIPFPLNLGPVILTIGILLYAIKSIIFKSEKANWILLGISLSGIILTIQTLFLPIYVTFEAHGHRVDILSPFTATTGSIFGAQTSVNNGIVFVQALEKTYPFTTTWEKLGFFPWFNILIGALFMFFFLPSLRKTGKYILGFFLLSGVYLILRYVLVIFVFSQVESITIFWNLMFIMVSFIPFALLLMRFAPLKNIDFSFNSFKEFKLNKNRIIAMFLIFIFVFSFIGAFVYQDPGTEKNGRILIDELHSDWEPSERALDKEWYGMLSTYNYYCWAEWLDKYYTVDRNIDNELTTDILKNYDILILKCPTNMYSNIEVNDIKEFVDNGGGLYLIGDHTNVFGMNFYLNFVSENFGITFNTNANYELGTGMTSTYKTDEMFPHVVVKNVEQFDFLTSCTLTVPITSENVIVGSKVFSEPGTYSTENFFRESTGSPDLEYGLLLQVAAVKYGKGRVLAFTDSTCFSNFCIFMDGYQAFNLGTMEYLNRINTYNYLNTVFIVISIISLIATAYFLRKEHKTMIVFWLLIIGILSFSIATPVFSNINDINYQVPTAHSDYNKVCFEEEYSDMKIVHLPSIGLYKTNKLFGTFFIWTQRVNCIPSVEKTLDDAISKGDVVVIINPTKSFDDEKISAVTSYIENGGQVLLMDSALNTDSTSNELLEGFNIELSYEKSDDELYKYNDSLESTLENNITIGNISTPYLKISGGTNVYVTEKNETSIAVYERGKGKIVVVVDSYTFNDNVLGGTFKEPDEVLREIYNTEYYLFEELLVQK